MFKQKKIRAMVLPMAIVAGMFAGGNASAFQVSLGNYSFDSSFSVLDKTTFITNIDATGPADLDAVVSPAVMRRSIAQVNPDLLLGSDAGGADTVSIDLFADVAVTASLDNFDYRNSRNYTWFGKMDDDPTSNVILTVVNDRIAGLVINNGNIYRINALSSGNYEITEIDQTSYSADENDVASDSFKGCNSDYIEQEFEQKFRGVKSRFDISLHHIIDVMVVYTTDAANSIAYIDSEIQLAVDVTNRSFRQSGVNASLQLVHSREISYKETGNMRDDIKNLVGTNDGYMDDIHAGRNTYSADIVALWTKSGNRGIAGDIMSMVSTSFAPKAFAVIGVEHAVNTMTFAHEIGHIMGARHEVQADDTFNEPFPYNHGYIDNETGHRTIMATFGGNYGEFPGVYGVRLPLWSDPDASLLGIQLGYRHPDYGDEGIGSNNARTLNRTAATVSNFRLSGNEAFIVNSEECASNTLLVDIENTKLQVFFDAATSSRLPNQSTQRRPRKGQSKQVSTRLPNQSTQRRPRKGQSKQVSTKRSNQTR